MAGCGGYDTTLRRSHDRGAGKGPRHLVSAWATANRRRLGAVAVDAKSHEITALPALLPLLALRGCIVTIDAMGCETAVARTIVAPQADYVLALTGNQGPLHQDVQELFTHAQATAFADLVYDHHRTVDHGHGRIDIRRYWTLANRQALAYLNPTSAWAGLRSVGMVEAERRIGAQASREVRYDVSSRPGDARTSGHAVRSHWGIENGRHWVLALAFREDESRVGVGHAAHNLASLRRFALTLLRQETTARCGIKPTDRCTMYELLNSCRERGAGRTHFGGPFPLVEAARTYMLIHSS